MNLFKCFNKKAGAMTIGASLLAAAAITQLPGQKQAGYGMYDGTKFGWDTMAEADAYKDVTAKARDLLIKADPAFKEVIANTALVFTEPRDENDSYYARFSMTPGKDRFVLLYKNDKLYDANYTFFSKVHAGQENAPTRDEFKTMALALNIANESAHYWQSQGNADLLLKLFKDGIACNDAMALEQSSDTFMVSTAVKLHKNLQGNDPDTKRLKNALEWNMQSQHFFDFDEYVKDPKTLKSQASLEDFMNGRDKSYRAHKGCDLNDTTTVSPDAQKALKTVQQKL